MGQSITQNRVFKHTGEPVEEYTNFNHAINDFVVLNGLIYTYLTGGDNEYFRQPIQLAEKSKAIISNPIMKVTNKHKSNRRRISG